MVLGAFPLGKLAVFGLKQVIKPVSGIVLIVAKRSTLFRRILCAPAGQFIHWVEVRSKMHMLKLPQPKRIPILRENAATDLGSKLIGELFVLTVGLYLIRLEISRQALKDKKKHEVHVLQRSELRNKLSTLKNLVKWQDDELNKLRLKLKREGESNDGRHK